MSENDPGTRRAATRTARTTNHITDMICKSEESLRAAKAIREILSEEIRRIA
jgi:hypothetical protein